MQSSATEIIDAMRPAIEIRSDRRPPPLGRRLVHVGAVLAIATIAIIAWGQHLERNARQPDVMLLYVGADDCAPCRAWRNGEGAAFLGSAEAARITYRKVESPHLEDVLKDENWPQDLRGYRNLLKRSDGVPLWLVVSDGKVVEQQFGTTAWKERILPKVMSYLR